MDLGAGGWYSRSPQTRVSQRLPARRLSSAIEPTVGTFGQFSLRIPKAAQRHKPLEPDRLVKEDSLFTVEFLKNAAGDQFQVRVDRDKVQIIGRDG